MHDLHHLSLLGWDCLALLGFHGYITNSLDNITMEAKACTLL
jgi:hypothetical protein